MFSKCFFADDLAPTGLGLFEAYAFSSLTSSVIVEKPHVPSRIMYARLLGSEAPVADEYKTLALGKFSCSLRIAFPVWVDLPAQNILPNSYQEFQGHCKRLLNL